MTDWLLWWPLCSQTKSTLSCSQLPQASRPQRVHTFLSLSPWKVSSCQYPWSRMIGCHQWCWSLVCQEAVVLGLGSQAVSEKTQIRRFKLHRTTPFALSTAGKWSQSTHIQTKSLFSPQTSAFPWSFESNANLHSALHVGNSQAWGYELDTEKTGSLALSTWKSCSGSRCLQILTVS